MESLSSLDMKVPKDQGLALTIFYSISLSLILMVWILLPPIISHENEEEDEHQVKVLKPEDAIQNVEEVLTQAEAALADMEKEKNNKKDKKGKAQGSSKGGDKK